MNFGKNAKTEEERIRNEKTNNAVDSEPVSLKGNYIYIALR
jgi:hypothetical protein